MGKPKSKPNSELIATIVLFSLVIAFAYLLHIREMGFFNDDWYLMYSAGAAGVGYFDQIFSVDRPARSVVHSIAYSVFGPTPLLYNLSALVYRVLGAVFFLWILRMLWPRHRRETLTVALLFLIYPGFLSQFNGVDYLPQLLSLACAFLSIGLSVNVFFETRQFRRWLLIGLAVLLGWFYVGLVEYQIAIEALRIGVFYVLVSRKENQWRLRTVATLRAWLPYSVIPLAFLFWNFFLFEGARDATSVSAQFVSFVNAPVQTTYSWASKFATSVLNASLSAWLVPVYQISSRLADRVILLGIALGTIAGCLFWFLARQILEDSSSGKRKDWRIEATGLGLWVALIGPLPVILANRQITFPEFSRYALAPSVGVAMLTVGCVYFIASTRLRQTLLAFLVALSMLTHFANGAVKAQQSQIVRNFWWQVAWRIPQLEKNTTLVVRYPLASIEEDYFIWGPANLIYYPYKVNPQDYLQPAIYAALPNDATVRKVLSETRQEFDNRRTIRTYTNYRNILIITQPSLDSCVQVIDGNQPELSAYESSAFIAMAPYSELERVLLNENEQHPPESVFGAEPDHGWCYFFEKASLARQNGNWDEVLIWAEQAHAESLEPSDAIEWLPFIQAYSMTEAVDRLEEISVAIGEDAFVRYQVCSIMSAMSGITPGVKNQIGSLFCLE